MISPHARSFILIWKWQDKIVYKGNCVAVLELELQREGIFVVTKLILYSNFSLFGMQAVNCSLWHGKPH